MGLNCGFYLLVPVLARQPTRTLVLLACASLVVRLATLDVPFYPWQQRFFPSEFFFFLVGMLAYRIAPRLNGLAALAIACALIAFSGHWTRDPTLAGSLILAGVLFFVIPAVFALTKHSAIDRFIGELSYPVYLWQVFVLSIFGYHASALLWCVLFSIPMVLFVEVPMERWRNRPLKPLQVVRS